MSLASDWFIGTRVRRLQRVIDQMRTRSPGTMRTQLVRELRESVDGPRGEIPELVAVLAHLGLLHVSADRFQLSQRGRRIATMSKERRRRELGALIIQAGFLHDQVRQLIEASAIDEDGSGSSELRILRQAAPQLLGILRAWPGVVGPSFVVVPSDLFATIDGPWSLIPFPQPGDAVSKVVGSRGEAYSVHLLRLDSRNPSAVVWVARDDEALGYDIEDRSTSDVQRIEVKASQRREVRFFLSAHEHTVAHKEPKSYGVHFWGEIDLSRDPRTEFDLLRERGFPLVFDDLAAHLADNRLQAVPTKYRVTLGAAAGSDALQPV